MGRTGLTWGMTRTREKAVERRLLIRCREHRYLCLKFTSPARGGVPDRVIVTPACTAFVEVKKPGERPDDRQRATHAKMRRFGAVVFVVDDAAGVDRLIEELCAMQQVRTPGAVRPPRELTRLAGGKRSGRLVLGGPSTADRIRTSEGLAAEDGESEETS